ncbi:hypothetical protein L6R50_10435 [Myxococcota bacterium]|nr:hypothetical protein [Myxococcota bacterium]
MLRLVLLAAATLSVAGCAPHRGPAEPVAGPVQDGGSPPPGEVTAPPPLPSPAPSAAGGEGRGRPCEGPTDCPPDLECLRYFGIAGRAGPEFGSCETPCGAEGGCPAGLECTSIADGPGRVCRAPR